MEEALLAAIAAAPDDDTPRLVFADWLDENGRPERAELIRLQCRLEPDRDRFDDADLNALHRRVNHLLDYSEPGREAITRQEHRWFEGVSGWSWATPSFALEWRRGFVDTVGIHAGTFVQFGRAIRQRYPLLRKLVVFALNGWGERLAACEWLGGIKELELACWYSDDDARAVASSPHLRSVERVVCWSGGALAQAEALARAPAWPKLRELHLVSSFGQHAGWVEAVNAAAGRPVASAYAFDEELYPFAHDFYDSWCEGIYAGKLPDGTQLIVQETTQAYLEGRPVQAGTGPAEMVVDGLAFDPDGTLRPAPFRLLFPPELRWKSDYPSREEMKQFHRARKEHLRRAVGFEPAFVRVRGFSTDWLGTTSRFDNEFADRWGVPDPPGTGPALDMDIRQGGIGADAYHWVRMDSFTLDKDGTPETFTRAGRSTGDAFVPW